MHRAALRPRRTVVKVKVGAWWLNLGIAGKPHCKTKPDTTYLRSSPVMVLRIQEDRPLVISPEIIRAQRTTVSAVALRDAALFLGNVLQTTINDESSLEPVSLSSLPSCSSPTSEDERVVGPQGA